MNASEIVERLKGPALILNGIALAVIGAAGVLWAVSGQPIMLPSWMGWLGILLGVNASLQVINGVLIIWLRRLEKRAALLREGE